MSAPLSEQLAAARIEVDHACRLLLSPTPEQLDQSARRFADAVAAVTACREAARRGSPSTNAPLVREARSLQQAIDRAQRLLEAAAAFHANWIQFLGALCAGYTDRGEAAAVERASRLCARG